MSREIKFRGWDHKAKCMFPIQDLRWDKINGQMTHLSGVDVKHPDSDRDGNMFFGGMADKKTNTPAINRYELMQYTGLKDKNGKEIYEGDIVQYVSEETVGERRVSRGRRYDTYTVKGDVTIQGVVQWENFDEGIRSFVPMYVVRTGQNVGYKTYFWTEKKSDLPTSTISQLTKPLYAGRYEYEVVGNIYANPELMEVVK